MLACSCGYVCVVTVAGQTTSSVFTWMCVQQKQLELGDRMDLASYLLKPVQRMGKYALLLKQILKECPETEPEYADLKVSQERCRVLVHGRTVTMGIHVINDRSWDSNDVPKHLFRLLWSQGIELDSIIQCWKKIHFKKGGKKDYRTL